jgi:hypothetical protein
LRDLQIALDYIKADIEEKMSETEKEVMECFDTAKEEALEGVQDLEGRLDTARGDIDDIKARLTRLEAAKQ